MVDESDLELPKTSSRKSSSSGSSSRSRSSGVESDGDLSDAPKKKKASRPSLKHSQSSGAASSGASFLTAAEQRALGKKSEKTSTEDPFEFLVDVRDVSPFTRRDIDLG